MADTTKSDRKYWAFISYSHRDAKVAQWLHKQLETFPIPKEFVGKQTKRIGQIPRRLFPIFRDKEEIPTSFDLGEVIRGGFEGIAIPGSYLHSELRCLAMGQRRDSLLQASFW